MSPSRRNIMLGTAGHVDHGKSALVRLLTGCETDTLAEEKQRGLTIDLGFAPCRLADKRIVGIVDVPGHVDFIRNMVAGAHGIDVVLFVVAADDGIMPQTHEHLHILTLMGLKHGIVALTKVDLVEEPRREFVTRELRRLLCGTFLENAPVCPVSNVTGAGYETLFESLNQVVNACNDRGCAGSFRMWVEDSFTIRGAGTVVTGIPTHGLIRAGERLQLRPGSQSSNIRAMQVYGENSDEGRSGECLALNLPEIDHGSVRRGMLLCAPDSAEPVTMFEADLQVLPSVKSVLEDYSEVQLHVGTAAVAARVAMLERTGMTGGERQFAQMRLEEPLPVIPGERFVIRANAADPSRTGMITVGGGLIIGITNTRLRRKRQWTLDWLAGRRAAAEAPPRWCEQMLSESEAPMSPRELERKCFARSGELTGILQTLERNGVARPVPGGAWMHSAVVHALGEKALAVIEAFHAAHPQSAGMSRDELVGKLRADSRAFDAAIEDNLKLGKLERNGALFARAGWNARLSDRDQRLCDQVSARFQQAGWAPPALEELAAQLKEPLPRIIAMGRLLSERNEIARLDDRIWMHASAVESGKRIALKLFGKAASFTTMDFRDALGVSRKFAVPLLDYLDRVRFTVRSGNSRTPGVEAKKRLNEPAKHANYTK